MKHATPARLNAAADAIERYGWASGTGWPADPTPGSCPGPLCLEGSLMHVLGMVNVTRWSLDGNDDHLVRSREYRAMQRYLGCETIYHWNDAPARTAAQVVAALRAAAVIETARESVSQPVAPLA